MGNVNQVSERRGSVTGVIERLREERAEMWVLFCRLAGIEPFDAGEEDRQTLLQRFCQTLVDYLASGHFLVYERIASGAERRQRVASAAALLYPRIEKCTEAALEFNDKYDCEDHCEQFQDLAQDLSSLGEVLAERIELEDRLLGALRVP